MATEVLGKFPWVIHWLITPIDIGVRPVVVLAILLLVLLRFVSDARMALRTFKIEKALRPFKDELRLSKKEKPKSGGGPRPGGQDS